MPAGQSHRRSDYERLISRLPVDARPSLREEVKHFQAKLAANYLTHRRYEWEEHEPLVSNMLMRAFNWKESKRGYDYWFGICRRIRERESKQVNGKRRAKLNRLLAKQIASAN